MTDWPKDLPMCSMYLPMSIPCTAHDPDSFLCMLCTAPFLPACLLACQSNYQSSPSALLALCCDRLSHAPFALAGAVQTKAFHLSSPLVQLLVPKCLLRQVTDDVFLCVSTVTKGPFSLIPRAAFGTVQTLMHVGSAAWVAPP